MSGWTIGPIAWKIKGPNGPADFAVAGWVKGPFGMDFRVFADSDGDFGAGGFVVSHLATGFVVRQLIGVGLAEAQYLADEILAAGDWSFTKVVPLPQELKLAVSALMKKHPDKISSGHSLIGPTA